MPTPRIPLSRRALGGAAVGAAAVTALGAGAPAAAAREEGERPFRAATGRRHSRRPNILFILGDDLGWADLSSYGAPHIRTPNLDRLARQGVRFTDAYSGSATCSPTRFSLYTGRFPGRTKGGLAEPIADRSVGPAEVVAEDEEDVGAPRVAASGGGPEGALP
ncbi:sulfatase family protein, partial [Streptomyces sp. MS191]|uniref:sulfatase family protein n=1 Tax=Streptomyces sp. ms191 TaxID=1827978 RepID=UPI0021C5FC3A